MNLTRFGGFPLDQNGHDKADRAAVEIFELFRQQGLKTLQTFLFDFFGNDRGLNGGGGRSGAW